MINVVKMNEKDSRILALCSCCGQTYVDDLAYVCKLCYAVIPDPEGLLNDVEDRVEFHVDPPPWEY